MDRTFDWIVNLTIIGLGAYLCTYAIYERRAAIVGICLIAFGGSFALVNHFAKQHKAPSMAPELPIED